jgi:hypothetical protein
VADERLRELERTWRATGAAADEAAWLVALARSGPEARARVELSAHVGHAPAREALGLEDAASLGHSDVIAPGEVPDWVQERGRGGYRGWAVSMEELTARVEPAALAQVLAVLRVELTAWALGA